MKELTENQLKVLFLASLFDIGYGEEYTSIPATISGWSAKHGKWEEDILEFNFRKFFPETNENVKDIINSLIEIGALYVEKDDRAVSYQYSYYSPDKSFIERYREELKRMGKEYIQRLFSVRDTWTLKRLQEIALRSYKASVHGHYWRLSSQHKEHDDLNDKALVVFTYQVYTGRYPYIYFIPENSICPASSTFLKEILITKLIENLKKIDIIRATTIENLAAQIGIESEDMIMCLRLIGESDSFREELGDKFYSLIYSVIKYRHRLTDEELEKIYEKLKNEGPASMYGTSFLDDLVVLGAVKENSVDEETFDRIFRPVKERWELVQNLLEYIGSNYIDYFPEEWKTTLQKSMNYMREKEVEVAFFYLSDVLEKFVDEIKKDKFKTFKKEVKEKLKADTRLEVEKEKISFNVDKLTKFIEDYLEKTKGLLSSMKNLRHIAFHKSSFFEFYTDQYVSILLGICVIAKILKSWGWDWYRY